MAPCAVPASLRGVEAFSFSRNDPTWCAATVGVPVQRIARHWLAQGTGADPRFSQRSAPLSGCGLPRHAQASYAEPNVGWHVAMLTGKRAALDKRKPIGAMIDEVERIKVNLPRLSRQPLLARSPKRLQAKNDRNLRCHHQAGQNRSTASTSVHQRS